MKGSILTNSRMITVMLSLAALSIANRFTATRQVIAGDTKFLGIF